MNLERVVALSVIQMQPETIKKRLLADKEFLSQAGLSIGTYEGIGEFKHDEVIAALEAASKDQSPVTVHTKKGKPVQLERTPQGIKATFYDKNEKAQTVHISDFSLLDPDPSVRTEAFNLMQHEYWPLLLGSNKWLSILNSRPLTEDELDLLLDSVDGCPKRYFREIGQKWKTATINVLDLIPSAITYYESLIGSHPSDDENVEQWITQKLLPYHQKLIEDDLVSGLAFTLPASLRRDISASNIIEDRSNDEIWDALQEIGQIDTPFVLLGVLQIALTRGPSDDRYKVLAATIIERLCAPELIGNDGIDTYQLMAPLLALCLRWVSIQEGLLQMPPYWRRAAAFVHCHFLLDILRARKIDLEKFPAWCNSNFTHEMIVAEMLDMQKEPMWRQLELTPYSLRSEVLGRLFLLVTEVGSKAIEIPNLELVYNSISELGLAGIVTTKFCGPLEGHLRRKTYPNTLVTTENHREEFFKLLACLRENPLGDEWEILSVNSKLFTYDDSMLDDMTQLIKDTDLLSGSLDHRQAFFQSLSSIAFIAASQPSETLANELATTLIRNAQKLNNEVDAGRGYQVILAASAAYCDRGHWLEWLEKRLADYAYFLPRGEASLALFQCLEVLMKLFPLNEWRFGKARKLSAAAL